MRNEDRNLNKAVFNWISSGRGKKGEKIKISIKHGRMEYCLIWEKGIWQTKIVSIVDYGKRKLYVWIEGICRCTEKKSIKSSS